MKVERARWLEDAMHDQQPFGHVGQVRQEMRLSAAQGMHPQPPEFGDCVVNAALPHEDRHRADGTFTLGVQLPHIAERLHLVRERSPGLVLVDRVVLPVGVEGRIEVDQVNARERPVLHDGHAVAVVEPVHAATASRM